MTRLLSVAAIIALATACAAGAKQVPVRGEASPVSIAGEWQGEYEGLESGRRGTIEFNLAIGRHTAQGEVLMHAVGAQGEPTPLRIEFVEVGKGRVTGKITPYVDPLCNCTVETRFEGSVRGNLIDGTFVTQADYGDSKQKQNGFWSVRRRN